MESANLPPGSRPTEDEALDRIVPNKSELNKVEIESLERSFVNNQKVGEAAESMNISRPTYLKLLKQALKKLQILFHSEPKK